MHNASSSSTAKGASETDGMCNGSEAVETDLAQSWLVGMVNWFQHYLNSAKNTMNWELGESEKESLSVVELLIQNVKTLAGQGPTELSLC